MVKVLWLAPNINHYKARFLNHLALDKDIDLTILSGKGRKGMGDQEIFEEWNFNKLEVNVNKKDFGKSKIVKEKLKVIYGSFDWIMIPAEKKNLPLFMFMLKLRKHNNSVRLFSYNHAQLKSKNKLFGIIDYRLSKFYNSNLDRVIFYSQEACRQAVNSSLIKMEKAFWANNTIDNTEIEAHYSFVLPPKNQLTILFIGRLIPSKRISDAILYYQILKQNFPKLKLEIIGDGPDNKTITESIENDSNILWHGTLVEEDKIAPIMKRVTLVFVPGLSGLSINHAFSYGRPYVTLEADKHGPEISYLDHGKNGFILNGSTNKNVEVISRLFSDREELEKMCYEANKKGKELSVQNWVTQIKNSLLHE